MKYTQSELLSWASLCLLSLFVHLQCLGLVTWQLSFEVFSVWIEHLCARERMNCSVFGLIPAFGQLSGMCVISLKIRFQMYYWNGHLQRCVDVMSFSSSLCCQYVFHLILVLHLHPVRFICLFEMLFLVALQYGSTVIIDLENKSSVSISLSRDSHV